MWKEVYNQHCTLYTAHGEQCTLYILLSTLYNGQHTLLHHTLCTVHCIVSITYDKLLGSASRRHTKQVSVFSMHCTVVRFTAFKCNATQTLSCNNLIFHHAIFKSFQSKEVLKSPSFCFLCSNRLGFEYF